jgi:hypothetical protein
MRNNNTQNETRSETMTYKVQRINIHSDYAPNREWSTMAKGLTESDANLYHENMKNSDNCVWRVAGEYN